MSQRKRWLVTLQQTRLRLEVVYGDTKEAILAEASRMADAASDEVWTDPAWSVTSVLEVN